MTAIHILAYASVLVFIVAVAVRAIRLATTPVHLRWELYPVAHEKDRVRYGGSYFEELDWWTKPQEKSMFGELAVMIPEILLLKGVWEYNRSLWWWSFPLHFGLYLVIGMAALTLVAALIGAQTVFGGVLTSVATVLGWIGYTLGVLGAIGLLIYRLSSHKLRSFSPLGAYFNLVFLLVLFGTGLWVFSVVSTPTAALVDWGRSLLTASSAGPVPGIVGLHVTVAFLFMLYLPFTHMTHFFTKYFTYHAVRWNDQPNVRGSKLEKAIQEQLAYPVSWSAKHLKADGKKTWADIATDTDMED